MPASTVHVRSPASCSSTRSSPLRSSSSIATPSTTACTTSGTLCKAQPLEWVLPVRTGDLAAETRRREQLAGTGDADRVERLPQPLHRLEVVLGEEEWHRAGLVGPHAVLAGDRA